MGKGGRQLTSVSADDLNAITQSARDLAYPQLDVQFQSSNNFDTKSVGVIAFDVAAVAGLLAATSSFYERSWLIPTTLLLLSVVFALGAVQRLSWDDGPDPRRFYEDSIRSGVGVGSAGAANAYLVSELGGPKGSIAQNDKNLRRKSGQFQLALWTTVIAAITTAVLVALSK
ncbi:MAG TPA: hypothetical protein VGU71_00600 [Candidatus Dormibacteraeota bacterium]|nr:hypothetical protein [Candidatus Dormibacteraeota bacterium]